MAGASGADASDPERSCREPAAGTMPGVDSTESVFACANPGANATGCSSSTGTSVGVTAWSPATRASTSSMPNSIWTCIPRSMPARQTQRTLRVGRRRGHARWWQGEGQDRRRGAPDACAATVPGQRASERGGGRRRGSRPWRLTPHGTAAAAARAQCGREGSAKAGGDAHRMASGQGLERGSASPLSSESHPSVSFLCRSPILLMKKTQDSARSRHEIRFPRMPTTFTTTTAVPPKNGREKRN